MLWNAALCVYRSSLTECLTSIVGDVIFIACVAYVLHGELEKG